MENQNVLIRGVKHVASAVQTVWNGAKQIWRNIRSNVLRIWGAFRSLFEPDEQQPEQREQERRMAVTAAVKNCLGDNPLQCICDSNIEVRISILASLVEKVSVALDIPTPQIILEETEKYVSGAYNFQTRQIVINEMGITRCPMDLDAAAELLDTFLHELYHAFQHEAIVSPGEHGITKELARIWSKNFDHYISYEQNPTLYYRQPVEESAILFAHDIVSNF